MGQLVALTWTNKASSDLDGIFAHYASLIGDAQAKGVVRDIIAQVSTLTDPRFKGRGRPTEVPDVRELVIQRWPFLAPYRVVATGIEALRVHHQRKQHPLQW